MATEEEEAKRDKRSLYLLIAGVAGLLLPLIAVAYMRMREASVPAGATTGGVFENRGEGARNRIKAALTPAPASSMPTALSSPAPTAAAAPADPAAPARKSFDSIGFIKGGNDYFQEAAKPAASVQAPAKTVAAEPEQEEQKLADAPPQAPAAKKGKKAFTMPKLQPSGGTGSFTSFKGGQGLGAGRQGQQGGGKILSKPPWRPWPTRQEERRPPPSLKPRAASAAGCTSRPAAPAPEPICRRSEKRRLKAAR